MSLCALGVLCAVLRTDCGGESKLPPVLLLLLMAPKLLKDLLAAIPLWWEVPGLEGRVFMLCMLVMPV